MVKRASTEKEIDIPIYSMVTVNRVELSDSSEHVVVWFKSQLGYMPKIFLRDPRDNEAIIGFHTMTRAEAISRIAPGSFIVRPSSMKKSNIDSGINDIHAFSITSILL